MLATLVEAYEQKHFPIDPPDPIEAIRFRLEQQGLDPCALVGVIGGRSHLDEVMQRKRALSLGDDPPPPPALRHSGRRADSPEPRRVALQAVSLGSRPTQQSTRTLNWRGPAAENRRADLA